MASGSGPIGGASTDAGTEYGRAVGAYAVALGLAGEPLIEFGPTGTDAQVESVAYQTDDALDDVRISFTTGQRCYVQAKRSLSFDNQFRDAVVQWVRAAEAGLSPGQHIAIVSGTLSGPLRTLAEVLDMLRAAEHGALTAEQQGVVGRLDELLGDLDVEKRSALLRAAHIVQLDVEEPSRPHAAAARMALAAVVAAGETANAWTRLLAHAGTASRLRQGHDLSGWLALLAPHVPLRDSGSSDLVRRNQVRGRYLDHVRSFGRMVDLRQLGAQLPRVPLADLDADVRVVVDPEDSRSTHLLVWAFLRRGRLVLTGLPGGGKSTALARLAADLSDLGDTIPILVRLRDIATEPGHFGDRLLDHACGHVGPADADDLRALLAEALATGEVTLVLDGLDETYNRRHQIVDELEKFLATVSPDVDVVLATRDVAYADAASLGWPDLRLALPAKLDHLIDGTLRLAAAHQSIGEGELDSWLGIRRDWVDLSLQREPSLRETPLLPTLLALLASERDSGALPMGRANVLWEMIEAVVSRSELYRGDGHRVGGLTSKAASRALLQAFELEADLLMTIEAPVSMADLVAEVGAAFASSWDLAAGPALVAAEEALRFWDETGVFTASGAQELVTPRLALFAEIGAARRASRGDPSSITVWVEATSSRGGFECLALAAGLNATAADAVTRHAVESFDQPNFHTLLMTAVRAAQGGAKPSAESLGLLTDALLRDATCGDDQGWESLTSALSFLRADDVDSLEPAIDAFPVEHRQVLSALIALEHPDVVTGEERRRRLRGAIETRHLPRLSSRVPPGERSSFQDLSVDRTLMAALAGSAHELAESDPELILQRLGDGEISVAISDELSQLMIGKGHAEAVAEIHRERNEQIRKAFHSFIGSDLHAYLGLISDLASPNPAALSRQQRRRLNELANLLETLLLNDASSTGQSGIHRGRATETAQLIASLAGLSPGLLSAQARVLVDRMALFGDDHGPYYALFDLAEGLPMKCWEQIADVDGALALARELLWGGRGSAQVAAQIYEDAPESRAAIEALRDVVRKLEDKSPDHLMMASYCLATQQDGFEPHWQGSQNPMLRRVVAALAPALVDDVLNPIVKDLLEDPDGSVRVEAVRTIARSTVPERNALLSAAAEAGNPEFTCLHCRRLTPANTQFCECHIGGAQPATEAAAALEG